MKAGWEIKQIGEILKLEYGKPLSEVDRNPNGQFPVYGANGEKNRTDKFYFDKPSIIVGRKGSAGEINLTENKFWPLDVTYFVTFDEKKHHINFLYYLLTSCDLTRLAKGVKPGINRNEVYDQNIAIPPLPEQRRIVAILDEAFADIAAAKEKAEQNLKNANEIFKSWFNAVSSSHEQTSWTKKTVSELVVPQKGAIRTGPFGSQLLHTEFVDEGISVLGIDNAVTNEFSWGKKRFITEDKYQQMKRYRVNPDDVLITIMGTCGRCAVVPEDIQTAINTKHLCCITLDKKKCLPWYLHTYFLYHPMAQDFLSKHAKGAIMAGLNMGIIRELPVLLPSIEKQNEIVAKFQFLKKESQRLEPIYQQKLSNLEELKKSLLQQAFSGAL